MRSFVNWRKRRSWIALAVLGAAALVLVAARGRERRRFEGAVGSAEAHLLARFELQAAALRSLAARPIATAAEFAAAVAALPDRGPPALGFARSFRRGETGEIEPLWSRRAGRLEEKRRIVLGGRAWTIRFGPPLP